MKNNWVDSTSGHAPLWGPLTALMLAGLFVLLLVAGPRWP